MKKITFLLFFVFVNYSYAQTEHPEKFNYELTEVLVKSGIEYLDGYVSKSNKYVVFPSTGAAEENYNKLIDFINNIFKNPSEVIVAKSENNYVKINGFESDLFRKWKAGVTFDFDVRYTMTFFVKDNRVKAEINSMEWFNPTGSGGKWLSMIDGIVMHKKNGKPRKSMVGITDLKLENYFNSMIERFKAHEMNNVVTSDDW